MGRDGDDGTADGSRGRGERTADADESVPEEMVSVVGALEDQCSREVLVLTAGRAQSADDIVAFSDSSRSTVYRRIRELVELDLLAETQELDPNGHHFNMYRARLDRVSIELDEDGFHIELVRKEFEDDAVARLNRLTERLKRS
ncbi:ArsR family transcriptional regulator [Haloarchaeobius amylolyticus]|uniref:ArsR family transcriptional regulator n=1 Tax=Haloarchaeobius amylolyticus TaxID=1198296 RepID=UPI00226D7CEF|nr:ArsR family transcriptional regulator [Haloarchaeobius amylolyticus]